MFSVWTQHIKDDKRKEQFKNSILASKDVLERATDIIKTEEDKIDRSEVSLKTYESPSWSHQQAHLNGYRAGLLYAQRLLNLDQQRNNIDQSN